MSAARILTTTVGSYPVPDWLVAAPSEQALVDATRVVIETQEQAGIDLVCDGELYRFDINHPETNGMIEYFVRPLAGVRNEIGLDGVARLSRTRRIANSAPGRPASSKAPIGPGSLDLPAACAARQAARHAAAEVHPHRPAHAGEDAARPPLPRHGRRSRMAIADVLAEQVKHLDADGGAGRRGEPAGRTRTNGNGPRRRSTACSTRCATTPAVHLCFGNYGGQIDPERHLGPADELSQRAPCRPRRHGERAPAARGARGVQGAAAGDRLRPRRGRHQAHRGRVGRRGRARDRARRQGARAPGASSYIHPDCGFWMLKRGIADGKIRALVQGRDLYEGRH